MGNSCHPCNESLLNCNKAAVINVQLIKEEGEGEEEDNNKDNLSNTGTNLLAGSLTKNKNASFSYENQKKDFKTMKINSFKLTVYNQEFLSRSLKSTVVFCQVPEDELSQLINIMYKIECKVGQEIVNLANPIVFFFVIKSGNFIVNDYDQGIKELVPESTFGENSIFQVEKLNGSIKCTVEAVIYGLNRKDYQRFIKERNSTRLNEKLYFLNKCHLFSK